VTRINPDDPKWTAYVFNELSESERAAVELELEASEDARMLIEELRFATELTKMELHDAVKIVPLTTEQREKIRASAEVAGRKRWFGVRPAIWMTGLAATAAASMVLAILSKEPQASRPIAAPQESVAKAEVKQPEAAAPAPALPVVGPPIAGSKTTESALNSKVIDSLRVEPPTTLAATQIPQTLPVVPPAITAPQMVAARMYGNVVDATAARIPGVSVTATNIESGATATTVTNQTGGYSFEGLTPGNYKLSAELPGFQTSVYNGIQLSANLQKAQDITLQVAAVADTVEVTTKSGTLSTQSSIVVSTGRQASVAGQISQQAFAAPPPPAIEGARAPGVPAEYDRIRPRVDKGGETYDRISDNPFLPVAQNPLSTFAIDVDTASYSNVRRYLNQYQLPPRDAVRIEEMINYFSYDYPHPLGNDPVGALLESASAPWNPQHRLMRVGIKARDIDNRRRPPSNLVFLLDVSGSMQPQERLPMLKEAIRMLVEQLTANDRVSVVTYAGTTGIALRPTRGDQKDVILRLIDSLDAGGSTNGGSGIQLAYDQATANFIPNGVNRVILATDGDFNVGITDRNALLQLIEDKAKRGVFLSVLGVGMGNYKDATLEMLADKGHGNYAYLDTLNEARKVLVEQMSGTLVTVAKDVKVQVEFNPAVVDAYRLIGYENRALRNEDFNNDLKDGGDMGAGHTVTVLYEVVPRGIPINAAGGPGVDPLKYRQPEPEAPPRNASNETLTVKIRYKEPNGNSSKLLSFPMVDREQTFAKSTVDFRFAAAVAAFGMILRESPYRETATMDSVLSIAEGSLGSDRNGYRREFLQLVARARQIRGR
jgi:Ca-activated chloride channel family protein